MALLYAIGVENDNIQEGLIDFQGCCRHGDTCELAERQTRRLHCRTLLNKERERRSLNGECGSPRRGSGWWAAYPISAQ